MDNLDNFEIIDAHVHLAPSMSEEEKRMDIPGRRRRDRWATPETAISFMDWEGISKAVVMHLPIMPPQEIMMETERQKLSQLSQVQQNKLKQLTLQIGQIIRQFNQWGCEVGQQFPRLIPFICIAPDLGNAEDIIEELQLRVNQGAKGVKLHPGVFRFYPSDQRLWPVYKKCQELGLPILADSAPSRGFKTLSGYRLRPPESGIQYGEPDNFAKVLDDFPHLTLILAHLGAPWWDERVELAIKYPNVYFDTAQGLSAPDQIPFHPHRGLAEEDALRIFRKIGVERIMFGSDGPAHDRQPQLEQIMRLPLNNHEKQMILSENAKRIFHI
jgi:predicted TIM-barrel fold metal-dependent hydrolase